ncbi:hypothetical protein PQU94_05320 [Asticcacaulis sp. DXS10W]|uniref:Uncharacterized protein n=1 Tax=Asticcacaulis currens TaxID=2984210 RepID=A0ABT5IBZ0_9CAUL|nr:hypothetical protein [Asticcacaulis currens]MDC7693699.1 hypothetical protein [Asticcacaulis currens]
MPQHLSRRALLISGVAASAAATSAFGQTGFAPTVRLPGELSAEAVLNGVYPYPPSPAFDVKADRRGFRADRVTAVPKAGVHPRILFSPSDVPVIRKRAETTEAGRQLLANLRRKTDRFLRAEGQWTTLFYTHLSRGDLAAARSLAAAKGPLPQVGHYKPWLYAVVLELFDALIFNDTDKGQKAASALATYVEMVRPDLETALSGDMNDDVWRAKTSGPITGSPKSNQGLRDGLAYHLVGYGYDFGHAFMTPQQRDTVRRTISLATKGRLFMGARLPHHFRNWNWIMVAMQQPLLALAIEGEEGYDPRVVKLGFEIARDYLTYGISPSGMMTEAIGYSQFGFVWGAPLFVAATRRGENLLTHGHHRATLDWYLQALTPAQTNWISHGDGGDTGPSLWTVSMWHHHFPDDPRVSVLWSLLMRSASGGEGAAPSAAGNILAGDVHLIEPLIWAQDVAPVMPTEVADLKLPLSLHDPLRGSLMSRSGWTRDAAQVQFECRIDSVGASHEHADRGHFTFSALGRDWGKDNFRSVESRHHSTILIDGVGQGYWPGPGEWLDFQETPDYVRAACDCKPAYDWFWPKQILTEDPDRFERFKYARWADYKTEAQKFQRDYAGVPRERDTRPSVVAFWKGFEQGDPRLWDEDGWPVRLPHNQVQKAFRSILFARKLRPWLLVSDDIAKDDESHLYEWMMQTGPDTEICAQTNSDIILCDASVKRSADGLPKPVTGDRLLLVRILNLGEPDKARDYQSRPSSRLETFERRDTLVAEATNGALSGSRSFGLDKRLVIASRSREPAFRILLYPHRSGEALPQTQWSADRTTLTLRHAGGVETVRYAKGRAGQWQAEVI